MSKHSKRFDVKFTKDLSPARAKLNLYPRFEKPKSKKRKIKKKKDNES